jgi:hypothetical protein
METHERLADRLRGAAGARALPTSRKICRSGSSTPLYFFGGQEKESGVKAPQSKWRILCKTLQYSGQVGVGATQNQEMAIFGAKSVADRQAESRRYDSKFE